MRNFAYELRQSAKVLAVALFLSMGVQYAFAWTGPTATPPSGNTSAPINVSATSQIKSGGLWVGSLGADGGGYFGGIIESTSGGVKFPDGTIQTTAATGGAIVGSNVYSCPVLSWNNCRFYCNGQLQLASTCRMGGPNNCGIGGTYDAACTLVGKIVAP